MQANNSKSKETLYLSSLSNLYGLVGLIAANKGLKSQQLSQQCVQNCLERLVSSLQNARQAGDYNRLKEIVSLIVDFSRGFQNRVENEFNRNCFVQVLTQITEIS